MKNISHIVSKPRVEAGMLQCTPESRVLYDNDTTVMFWHLYPCTSFSPQT